MNMRCARPAPGVGTLFRIVVFLGLVSLVRAEWHVPDAPLRYTVELTDRPTHKAAGYVVHLPDGGLLSRSNPLTDVFTTSGERVESAVLWHSPLNELTLAFASPSHASAVHVYVRKAMRSNLWTPESGIRPSAILCVDPTTSGMSAARKLASFGRVGPTVHCSDLVGYKKASFCIGGDPSGRPRPASFYLLSHLVTADPGRTWISYFVMDGTTEVRVNGNVLTPEKRIDKWGGIGAYVDLDRGLNRFEVFQTAAGRGGFDTKKSGGLMYLTWRTPNATMAELGGERSKKVPMTGTSRMETRVVRENEIARSGRGRILGMRSRDGRPLAAGRATPKHVFWLGNEKPILLYELEAYTRGNPDGTQYSWQCDSRGTAISGSKVNWLFPGHLDNRVKLTAALGASRLQSVLPFYGYARIATDLNDASTRKDFLDASLSMFKAARSGVDPTASCGSAYWKMLSHVVAIGEGDILLDHLISQRLALMRKHLPMSDVERMQEIVLDGLPRRGPEPAIAWIAAQRRKAASRSFLNKLTMAECEIRMHYQGESNTVNNLLVPLIRQTGEIAEIARIRMGDLAFVSGDLNRATELYADVQNRVRHHRNATSSPGGRTRRVGERVDNWKLTAFLGVSVSETVKSLMDQGQLSAAHKTLQAWERQFPLSKVSGDYVLQEARYYMALEDWVRARSMLEAYCELVDASSYIPDASLALLTCMLRMDAPQEEVRTFCKAMSERLAFHPAGETFRARLRGF